MRRPRRLRPGLRLAGAGLLIAAGAVHLDLYLTGYRSIPVIGWLFLLQVIAAFVLAAVVLASGSRLAAAAGAGFAAATLGGYLLSVWIGLFGFREVRTTAGIVVGLIEVAAFAVLAILAAGPGPAGQPARAPGSAGPAGPRAGVPGAGPAVAGLSLVALALLGAAVAGAGSPAPPASAARPELTAGQLGGVRVLADGKGFTLYWFAPDTPASSACNGTCAAYWPPVTGTPSAGPGVTGRLGTIRRADGSTQATYDGHPLYTYVGDTAPGQANGNNLNLNGGLWHQVPALGSGRPHRQPRTGRHRAELPRNAADPPDGTHGGAAGQGKKRLSAAAAALPDPHARQALTEINADLLPGTGEVIATTVSRRGGGPTRSGHCHGLSSRICADCASLPRTSARYTCDLYSPRLR